MEIVGYEVNETGKSSSDTRSPSLQWWEVHDTSNEDNIEFSRNENLDTPAVDLGEHKVKKADRKQKRDKSAGKEIDWSLIESNEHDPEVKGNMKIKVKEEEVIMFTRRLHTFSEALREQENFDEILINIALTGEKSGKMVFSLNQVAEYYEQELSRQIDSLLELVQPLSILLIGLTIAPIIIAAYLPILDMSSGAGLF